MKTQPDWVDIALLRPLPEDSVYPKERMIPLPTDCVVMRFIAKMQKRLEAREVYSHRRMATGPVACEPGVNHLAIWSSADLGFVVAPV